MAISAPHMQKAFKLTLQDGLPQAAVEIVGQVHWLRCCPLCGSMHQILGATGDAPYVPLCQTAAALYKAEISAWQKLHPDVVNYKSVRLVAKAA
ncbi:MAG: hypothetical protein IT320_12530 [Anaerolineae bacterium]|nr:hypothetical protein [Anaerolineae bacterium]